MPRFTRFYPSGTLPQPGAEPAIFLPFVGDGELLVHRVKGQLRLLRSTECSPALLPTGTALLLGHLDGVPCWAYTVTPPADDDTIDPLESDGVRRMPLRSLFGALDDDETMLAGYAAQLIRWHGLSKFCPSCGGPTHNDDGWNRKCAACGFSHYPPVSPAVLILVHDGGDRILLARKPGWGKRCSILAGFVEPGESLEDCCRRETIEEVGVTVDEVSYDGSQTWPFPHQLMVGFVCRYASGEIVPDPSELEHAAWYHWNDLPELPPAYALSRQLIDRWIHQRRGA